MREAAIDRPRAAPRKRPSPAKTRRVMARSASVVLGILRRHPGQVLAGVACLALAGTIVGNAMLFQTGRHPAPLFARSSASSARPETSVASVPMPAPRPVEPVSQAAHAPEAPEASPSASSDPKSALTPPSAVHASVTRSPGARKEDAIARLLHGEDKTSATPSEADPRVVAAQRSLAKLGYTVKPDGHMGHSTRQALEKFEHDHHLDAGGELSSKLLHKLATAAALPPG